MFSVRRDVRSAGDGQDGQAEAYRSTARNEQPHRRGRHPRQLFDDFVVSQAPFMARRNSGRGRCICTFPPVR